MAKHKNHSATIRKFDEARMKYHYTGAMNAILDLFESLPDQMLSFEEIRTAIPGYCQSSLYHANHDLRRLGLRTFVAKEGDLRCQYSTTSRY